MKTYNLIDYKGKFDIIQDKDYPEDEWGMDIITGEITHEEATKNTEERKEAARYYGVPAYIGSDPELLKIYGN